MPDGVYCGVPLNPQSSFLPLPCLSASLYPPQPSPKNTSTQTGLDGTTKQFISDLWCQMTDVMLSWEHSFNQVLRLQIKLNFPLLQVITIRNIHKRQKKSVSSHVLF